MGKFDELFGKPKEEPDLSFVEIGGTFNCQVCEQYVFEAKWYQVQKLLVWECVNGHKSYIEGFG